MILTVGNKLTVSTPTKAFADWCDDILTFNNPEYISRERLGKWTGGVDKYITLYERRGNDIILPFGMFARVWREWKDYFALVASEIAPVRVREYNCNISLRPYQELAIDAAIKAKNGILVAPCGSGKTQMGLVIAAILGGKTLWLTHTQDLLTQSMNRARECFDIPASEFGTITGGKVNVGNTLTFATVQTMSNIDLAEYKNEWDTIIVDECHHCVGSPTRLQMFYKVLSALSARYKFGLTATPYRADRLDGCMRAIIGDIVHEVKREEVADNTCPVRVKFVDTGYTPNPDNVLLGDGSLVYPSLIDDLVGNRKRAEYVADIIRAIEKDNKPILVLSERIDHLRVLRECLPPYLRFSTAIISATGQSKAAREERKEALANLNSGKLKILFATYKLAKEGLDVPNLGYVVFASPIKDKTTVTQAAGRVARKVARKEFGTIIDFNDNFGLLRGWARQRKNIYKKLGYDID